MFDFSECVMLWSSKVFYYLLQWWPVPYSFDLLAHTRLFTIT